MSAMPSASAPVSAQQPTPQTSIQAKPVRQPGTGALIIVKLHHNLYALDLYADRLSAQGYSVMTVPTYDEALELVHRYHPALIIVHDDPDLQIDAVQWLEMQHTDRLPWLAMIPLIILADGGRVPALRI